MCSTYPVILCIPSEDRLSDDAYATVASFRSRGRAPALTWKNPYGSQTIWRCSQPRSGVTASRCPEDEFLFELIGRANPENHRVTIFDARPFKNAMGNRLVGKGYENVEIYKNCRIYFMNIENIHGVRESYSKLVRSVLLLRPPGSEAYAIDACQSGWYSHISDILAATAHMVHCVDGESASIVCHCSDGWDRTSQLTSLAKLCLDPYYRTIRGFAILVEQEWTSFGHKFRERFGHSDTKLHDQRSPVFIQFLDCVYQLTVQFPRHFQFNSEFLAQIALHVTSCR